MKKLICNKCGKKIEGYTDKHVEFLMKQHMLKHKREEERENAS